MFVCLFFEVEGFKGLGVFVLFEYRCFGERVF